MGKNHFIFNLKIFFALLLAFFISSAISKTVFFEKTPKLNYLFLADLFPKKPAYKNLLTTPLSAMTSVAPGVYAKEDKDLKTIYIRITSEVRWEEKILESDGKKIRILYPKSQN